MGKIARVTQLLFGSTGASSYFGKPGSLPDGTKVNTKDPATIQSMSAFLGGLQEIVKNGTYKLAMEDHNSLLLLGFYQIAYLMQAGIAEWDSGTTYYIGSLANVSGTIYKSLTDDNINNNPASSSANWAVVTGTAIGTVQDFAGPLANIPTGFLHCDGSAVSRTTYANLFAAIGTYWGSGNGSTTFNLPDFRGKVAVGYNASDSDVNPVGKTAGEKTVTLTVPQMPSHSHEVQTGQPSGGNPAFYYLPGYAPGAHNDTVVNRSVNGTGGGQPHNNMQPYGVVLKIIKY